MTASHPSSPELEPGGDNDPVTRSRIEDLRIRGLGVKEQAARRLDDAVSRFWPVALVVEAARRWLSTNASILAGHLAFRFFLFLVPSAVVLVSFLGLAASTSSSSVEDTTSGSLQMGNGGLAQALVHAGDDTSNTHVQLGLAGLVGLLIAGLSLVSALRSVFAAVWGVSPKVNKKSKLLTLFGLIVLVGIFIAANALRRRLTAEGLIFTTFGIAAMLAVSCVFIAALSWLLPRRGVRLVDLIPSAVVGGVGLTLLNTGAAWYFTGMLENQSETYGAMGITLTLLTYLFVWGEVLVLSAVAGAVWHDRDEILGRTPDSPVDGLAAGPLEKSAERRSDGGADPDPPPVS